MEREIGEQPEVLARGAERYLGSLRGPLSGDHQIAVLVARGSSDHAALYARYLFEVHLQIPVSLAAPSVLTRYGSRVRYRRGLGIGISQSGEAPDVAEVLAMLRAEGHMTLAITNTGGSRLTREAEESLLLEAGEERSVAATKTYTASLLALYEATRALGAGGLPSTAGSLPTSQWIAEATPHAREAAEAVVAGHPVFGLGRGFRFASAQEAALKLMECALIPCKAYSSADFEHGPKALAGPGSVAISFDGDKPGLRAQGCRVLVAPSPPSVSEELLPLWDAVFAQLAALFAARLRGLDPDVPQHLQKVTRTR